MMPIAKGIALTGANGMVGRHVAAALSQSGTPIIAAGRNDWDLRSWLDDRDLDRLFGTSEIVIHAGAAVPSPGQAIPSHDMFDANVRACLCLGQWCQKRGRFLIFVSGAIVYAHPERPRIAEDAPVAARPMSAYGLSKLLAEQVLDNLAGAGLGLCVVRPSSIYGTGMPESRMVATMLGKARRDESIVLVPPIADRINLVHAADVAYAIIAAAKAREAGVFNIAGPRPMSILEIAECCVLAAEGGKVVVPEGSDDGNGGLRYDLNCDKAALGLAYHPRISLEDGLRRMLAAEY